MLKVWFSFHASNSLAETATRYDVIVMGDLHKGVHVLYIHDGLVDLLPG
jgi:hypothetical protein